MLNTGMPQQNTMGKVEAFDLGEDLEYETMFLEKEDFDDPELLIQRLDEITEYLNNRIQNFEQARFESKTKEQIKEEMITLCDDTLKKVGEYKKITIADFDENDLLKKETKISFQRDYIIKL